MMSFALFEIIVGIWSIVVVNFDMWLVWFATFERILSWRGYCGDGN